MTRSHELIEKLRDLYAGIDRQTAVFAAAAGLSCPSGCGSCCETFEIEVTELDCLPLAQRLIENGNVHKVLAVLESAGPDRCPVYLQTAPGNGSCGVYSDRPALCRLFGYAALKNKSGDLRAATCDILKNRLLELYRQAEPPSSVLNHAPVMEDTGHQLAGLDPSLGAKHLPIGTAIRQAIERLLLEQDYQPGPVDTGPVTST